MLFFFVELFHWNLQISWGNCTLNNSKTCGNGFKYKVPDECMYNTTELTNHEEEKWRCGEVPIHVRSCYVPCAGKFVLLKLILNLGDKFMCRRVF